MIETSRLQLLPCTLHHFEALFQGEEVSKKALSYYNVTVRELADNDEIIRVPEPDPDS